MAGFDGARVPSHDGTLMRFPTDDSRFHRTRVSSLPWAGRF